MAEPGPLFDSVWANEGNVMVEAERIEYGEVVIKIWDTSGRESRLLAKATLADFRWDMIVKAVARHAG